MSPTLTHSVGHTGLGTTPIGGAWLLVAIVLVSIIVLAIALVRYYSDPDSSHWFASLVFIACVVCSLLCVALIPIDVQFSSPFIKTAFVVLFTGLIILAFIAVPFAYFIAEEEILADIDDEPSSGVCMGACDRICSAAKATAIFVAICCLLLIIGLLLDPARHRSLKSEATAAAWMESLMTQSATSPLERALLLIIAVLTTIGFLNFVLYAGYGIGSLPLSLIRGTKDVEEERLTIEAHWSKLRERRAQIERRTAGWSERKRAKELASVQAQLIRVSRQRDALQHAGRDCSYRCARAMAPFRSLIGIALAMLSFLIIVSLSMALLDRSLHSFCGLHCGFLLDAPIYYNPLDHLLVSLAKYFPMDLLVLTGIALYLFICTIYGVFKNGVRIAFQVFELKRGQTWPQALIVAGMVLLLSVLATITAVNVMAPQYTAFGHQHFVHQHGALRHCHLTASFGKNYSASMLPHHTTNAIKNPEAPFQSFATPPMKDNVKTTEVLPKRSLLNDKSDDQNGPNHHHHHQPHHPQHSHKSGQRNNNNDDSDDDEETEDEEKARRAAAPRTPLHRAVPPPSAAKPPSNRNTNGNTNNNNNNNGNNRANTNNKNQNNNRNNNNSGHGSTGVGSGLVTIGSTLNPGMLLHGECRMSEMAQMITRMTVSLPFFAVASFFGCIAFIMVVIICAFYQATREKPSFYQADLDHAAEEAVDHELRGLIPATI